MAKSAYIRPKSLPDFSSPPLSEVVLGVQFQSPIGYQQIHAGDVWRLFKDDYPIVQEHQALAPTFENFGLSTQSMTVPINLISGAMHDRFWFLESDGGNELLQFQQDRLLHNWRKFGSSKYPRFKYMIDKLEKELKLFESFANGLAPQNLNINQCEISFINQILVDDFTGSEAGKWLRFLSFDKNSPNDFNLTLREAINNAQNKPQGRLIVEVGSAIDGNGKKIIQLNLTARGAPDSANIKSALDFLAIGHDLIVNRFAELTTDEAHQKWGRTTNA